MTDYRSLRIRHKTKKFQIAGDLKKGVWVPVSIAALLSGYSTQFLRLAAFKGLVETGRFEVGPLLVNLGSLAGLQPKKH